MLWPIYALGVIVLLAHGPEDLLVPGSAVFVVLIGTIGIWRYGWGLLHHLRAIFYRSYVFPRVRAAAEERQATAGGTPLLRELYIVITSYRIPARTTADALRTAVEEAIHCGCPTVIVASIVEPGDERMLKSLFHHLQPPAEVRLALTRLPPRGKRLALGAALRAVARCNPVEDAAVVVMDGDTLLTRGSIKESAPLLALVPSLGALTTDETAIGDEHDDGMLLRWHRLRFAQRHVLMCSLGLSGKLLVLTGRMSIFRARIATDPEFIRRIEQDSLEHWRLGRIPLLTGEDKSTWLWLLERGYLMLYVPDVQILTREHPPTGHFLSSAVPLMVRWFGNMLRANGRALALGPRRIGLFPWWCLVDQRISMWTPLCGPIAVAFLAIGYSPDILYAYGIWVIVTRCILASALFLSSRSVDSAWPLLILFNQLVGSAVKTWVLFRLDRQRWTRQGIGRPLLRLGRFSPRDLMSGYLHVLAMLALIVAIGFATGGLSLPGSLSFAIGSS